MKPDQFIRRRHGLAALACAAIGAATFAIAGCMTAPHTSGQRIGMSEDEQQDADRAFSTEPFQDQIKAGVIRQRTLFEHHFETDSPALNGIGRRDLSILAKAMGESGGRISVQRGGAGKELYAARLKSVRAALASAGIPAKRLKLDDAPPGGSGALTTEAVLIRRDLRGGPLEVERGEVISNEADEGGEE